MEKPPKDTRKGLKPIWLVTYAIVLFVLLYRFDSVSKGIGWFFSAISPLLLGLFFAYLFFLPMHFFQYKVLKRWENSRHALLRKLWRGVSLLLAYVCVALALFGLGALIFPRFIESLKMLASNFSGYLTSFQIWADGFLSSLSISASASNVISNVWDQLISFLQSVLAKVVDGALGFTAGLTSGVMNFALALMFSGFFLYNREKVSAMFARLLTLLFGEKPVQKTRYILATAHDVFSHYIFGQLTEALVLGVLCFIGMRLFKMEYALLISTIIAITAIIPILGAWIGAIPCAVILLVLDPMQAVWFVVFIIVLQQIEGDFIYPHVVGNAIGVSGMWVLLGLIVGGGLFGVWGMLFGTPVTALCYRLINEWMDKKPKPVIVKEPSS